MLVGYCIVGYFGGSLLEGDGIRAPPTGSKSRDHHPDSAPLIELTAIIAELLSSTPKTMDKATLPRGYAGRKPRIPLFVKLLALSSLASLTFFGHWLSYFPEWNRGPQVPLHAAEIQARCRALDTKPGPPSDFYDRNVSDRFVEGTKRVWIRNATIWTGRVQGLEVVKGDVFLMNGIIKAVGHVELQSMGLGDHDGVEILDAHGAYVTPGCVLSSTAHSFQAKASLPHRIVDLHSHMGVGSSPSLEGAQDLNSAHGPIVSWLRSIDGINTHDAAYELAVAGGVTASLILPGSANAIGKRPFNLSLSRSAEHSRRW